MSIVKRPRTSTAAVQISRWQWYLALLFVTLAALAVRLYYVTHAVVLGPVRGDASQYYAYAWNLAHHGVFSKAFPGSSNVVSDSFRDPGYPAFLAIGMKLFDNFQAWYVAILTAQALLGALTVSLLMAAVRGWIADRWLIAAGLAMAFWPHSIAITSFLLTETLVGFLCALALYIVGSKHQRPGWLAACGLCFGVAALTNAILVPFGVLLAGALFVFRRVPGRLATVIALATLVLPSVWGLRNLHLPPSQTSSSGRALMNFVQGSWPAYHSAYRDSVSGKREAKQTMQTIQHEINVTIADPGEGLRLISQRMNGAPLHYLAWYLSKPARLWGWDIQIGQGDIYVYPTANSPLDANPFLRAWSSFCQAINPVLMVFALGGLFLCLKERESAAPVAVGLLVLYVTLLYSALQAEPRYSIPFKGLELLLAAHGLQRSIEWLRREKIRLDNKRPPVAVDGERRLADKLGH